MTSDSQYAHKRAEFKTPLWERLGQDEVWTTREGRTLRLEDLDASHRRNLIAWLERRARDIKFSYETSMLIGPQPSGDMARDAFDAEMSALWEQDAMEWLNEQPLMIRLRQLEAPSRPVSAMDAIRDYIKRNWPTRAGYDHTKGHVHWAPRKGTR